MTQTELENRFISARKKLIESDFAHLNPMQRQAVMTTEGPLLLLAGAGSGKTTVLINRMANLLRYGRGSDSTELPDGLSEKDLQLMEHCAAEPGCEDATRARALAAIEPVEPWRMMAITFTNKAADELKARLERMLGQEAADIWAMTFHSACVRILRRDADKVGFDRSFTIYDTSDSQSVMKRILKDMDLDEKVFPHKSMLSQISKAKDAMADPETYLQRARATGDTRRIRTGEVYAAYVKRLKDANAMDFDDLIYYTVRLLTEHDDVREYYQRRFRYVLIDEYQDTNNLQYMLASSIAGGYENICVVGDDDQSIYKFRGATIENILSFENQYRGARVIRLEQNYRSTGHILSAANAVIRNNQGRKGKELWTDKDDGEKLVLYTAQNQDDEAQYVASRILERYTAGENWQSNAVLYRMNAQSNQLEYAFKRNGIPYRIIGGTRFFDRAEVKDMLAYLCVIMAPSDDLRLSRIINTPVRGIGDKTVDVARAIAAQEGVSLFEILQRADSYPELQRTAIKLRQFANFILEMREAAQTVPPDELYDELIEKTGYIRALEAKNTDENIARIENVRELKSNIITYMNDTGDRTLAGFLDEVALYTDMDQYDSGADCVVMMTMHSAKGLEFPNVFIVGAEEGIFPGLRSIGEPDEMEEERRLCYVAMTRAERRLYICCAHQRMIFGRTTSNKVSRFVEEIPADDLERTGMARYGYAQHGDRESYIADRSGYGEAGQRYSSGRPAQNRAFSASSRPKPVFSMPASGQSSQKPSPEFEKGDVVNHKAFGHGTIVTKTPMGGDFLVEISFDGVGTKKLMLRVAAQHMTKE